MKKDENIILIGFMGCGKTSVGIRLAKTLGYRFVDTDQVIETEYGASISAIFEKEGEEGFRRMETAVVKRLHDTAMHTVISTGGGLPLRKENVELMKEMGCVIYLKTNRETTLIRLSGDTERPLLSGPHIKERIDELLQERVPLYEAAADESIIADNRSFHEILQEIEELWNNKINKTCNLNIKSVSRS